MSAPDPMKGIRGVFSATLVLEAIVVLLALLVLPKFGGATPLGAGVITAVALLMIVACAGIRRSWGLPMALALQVATILCVFFVPALGVMGGVFALVWLGLLWLRRDVAQKMARGELPAQRGSVPEP